MPLKISKYIELPTSGTIQLPANSAIEKYVIYGATSLSANINIVTSGSPKEGSTIEVIFLATPTRNGNTITIFGKALEKTSKAPIMFTSIYLGGTWNVIYTNYNIVDPGANPLGPTDIGDDAVQTQHIGDGQVTIPQLDDDILTEGHTLGYFSTSGNNNTHSIYIPYKYQLLSMAISSIEAMITDDLNYTISLNGAAPAYTGVIKPSFPRGGTDFIPFADTPVFKAPSAGFIQMTPNKSTVGGGAIFTFVTKRIV